MNHISAVTSLSSLAFTNFCSRLLNASCRALIAMGELSASFFVVAKLAAAAPPSALSASAPSPPPPPSCAAAAAVAASAAIISSFFQIRIRRVAPSPSLKWRRSASSAALCAALRSKLVNDVGIKSSGSPEAMNTSICALNFSPTATFLRSYTMSTPDSINRYI